MYSSLPSQDVFRFFEDSLLSLRVSVFTHASRTCPLMRICLTKKNLLLESDKKMGWQWSAAGFEVAAHKGGEALFALCRCTLYLAGHRVDIA